MDKIITKPAAELYTEIASYIDEAQKALENGNDAEMTKALANADEAEKAYATARAAEVYAEIAHEATARGLNPVIEAIKVYEYTVLRHRVKRGAGEKIESIELATATKQIDLLKFCQKNNLPSMWQYTAAKMNQLMCIRLGRELKLTPEKMAAMSDSYFMSEKVKEVKLGGTPDSNTKLCAMMSKVVAEMTGDETLKANTHDVRYILACYTRRAKERLTVKVTKDGPFRALLMDVANRIITNGEYDVNGYRVRKDSIPTVSKLAKTVAKPAEKKAAPKVKAAAKKVEAVKAEPEVVAA